MEATNIVTDMCVARVTVVKAELAVLSLLCLAG